MRISDWSPDVCTSDLTFLQPVWAELFTRSHMPIDAIIAPEIEVARAVMRRLEIPGAFDAIPLSDGLITLIGVRCDADCPVINTPLRHLTALFPELHISVVGILRNDRKIVPTPDDQMLPGDRKSTRLNSSH